ncbi:MAG: hypothetical protein ACLQBL_09915 [Polyangiaceae bacterium]
MHGVLALPAPGVAKSCVSSCTRPLRDTDRRGTLSLRARAPLGALRAKREREQREGELEGGGAAKRSSPLERY